MGSEWPVERGADISGQAVEALRAAVGWDAMWGCYDGILKRSYTHFTVMDKSRLIGFLNVISDGIGDAFLVDLMVHPDFRKRKVGKSILMGAIAGLKGEGIKSVQVVFSPELEPFFRKCGFSTQMKAGVIE